MKLLLEHGAQVNARAKSRYSALMVAAHYREGTPAIRLLLEHGAEVAGTPSPLLLATSVGNPDALKLLHDAGAPFDRTMVAAARLGKIDAVRALLEIGAPVDEPDGADTTPLERAVLANELDIARLLIAHGANVNHVGRNGMTPLLYAASIDFGDAGMIDLLLKAGAKVDVANREGKTAAVLAREYGHSHLIGRLAQ
jgi:ankyrin repeat protein